MFSSEGAVSTKVTPSEKGASLKELENGLLPDKSPGELSDEAVSDSGGSESTVSITVVGASGDLAKKKIFPALFALYYEGCLPKVCVVSF